MATAPSPKENVRGAGRPTAGASDTTMLIWQTIEQAGERGITRGELFARLEERIPAGYALRLRRPRTSPNRPGDVRGARRHVLGSVLGRMVVNGNIVRRRSDRTYTTLRKPRYYGDEQKIDVDGNIAARHMAIAEALRILRPAVARNRKWLGTKRMHGHLKAEEMAALEVLLASFQ